MPYVMPNLRVCRRFSANMCLCSRTDDGKPWPDVLKTPVRNLHSLLFGMA
eukprot:COSAG02_NODE_735_length_17872_cov_20.966860_11_plen_50_part_00